MENQGYKGCPYLTITDTPLIDDNYHYALSLWIMQYIYHAKGQLAEAEQARVNYENEMRNLLWIIGDLTLEPYSYLMANTSNFE